MTPIETPALNRMKQMQYQADVIGAFLDWAHQNNLELCERPEDESAHWRPFTGPLLNILGRYFNFDPDAVERELQQLRDAYNLATQDGQA